MNYRRVSREEKPGNSNVPALTASCACTAIWLLPTISPASATASLTTAAAVSLTTSDDAARHALRSLLRAPHAAREHKLHREGLDYRTRNPLRTATAGDRADVHLGLAELGIGRREEYVCHQRELAPASELRRARTHINR